jgi:GNAT superfamily N-acetyltransferase
MNEVMNEVIGVDGIALTVRPIEITDVERLARMFGRLSPESVYSRYFSPIQRLPRSALLRLVDVDHCRRDALVALDGDEIVAVARYSEVSDEDDDTTGAAEIAVTVVDDWQHRGLGRRLARRLAVLARERGYVEFVARILATNRPALGLVRKLAPDARVRYAGGEYETRLPLTA